MFVSVSIQTLTTLDIVFGCLKKIRSPMSLSSARALHILLSRAMKSLLLISAVLTLDLKFTFGNGFRTWSPFGLRQYNVNGNELPPELQPSGKFYMNIIT